MPWLLTFENGEQSIFSSKESAVSYAKYAGGGRVTHFGPSTLATLRRSRAYDKKITGGPPDYDFGEKQTTKAPRTPPKGQGGLEDKLSAKASKLGVDDEQDEFAGPRDAENEQRNSPKGEKSQGYEQAGQRSPRTRTKPEYSRTKYAPQSTGAGEPWTATGEGMSPGNVGQDQESNPNLHGLATFLSKKGMSEDVIGEACDCASRDHQRRMSQDQGDAEQDLMRFLASKGLSPDDIHQACAIRFGGGAQDDESDLMERAKEGIDDEPTGPPGEVALAAGQRLGAEPGRTNLGYGQSDQDPSPNKVAVLVQLLDALEEEPQQDQGMQQMSSGRPASSQLMQTTPNSGVPMANRKPAQDAALSLSDCDANAFYRRFPHAAKIGGHFST